MKNRPNHLLTLCALSILSALLCYPAASLAHDTNENATITVNASSLRISMADLKEAGVDPAKLTIDSIPIIKVLWCIAKDKCRITNALTLTMTNGGKAEIQTENIEVIDTSSDSDQAKSENILNKTTIAFEAQSSLTEDGKIIVAFQMTSTEKEHINSKSNAKDPDTSKNENITNDCTLKVSSEISLKPNTPTIAAAIKTKTHADLIIITADILD